MLTLTDQIALFSTSLAGDVENPRLRLLVLDALGAGLAGHRHPAPVALRGLTGAAAEAGLIGGGRGELVATAAANAAAIHALDFDDTHRDSLVHVSSMVAPVCLALTERQGLDLARFLGGYALGVRLTGFAQRIGPLLNGAGFHTTATLGAVVAAAAGAWVLTEDAAQAAWAAELAATSAMGLTASFGTDTKPAQVGRAAANATSAALLAGSEISAPRGFTDPAGLVGRLLGPEALDLLRWGEACDEALEAVVPKPYPCCYLTHGAVRSALELRDQLGATEEIEAVEVSIGPLAAELALKEPVPGDAQVAKFSTAYCVAHALATGRLGVADFDDPLADPGTRRLAGLLTTTVEESLGPVAARVRVRLRSGEKGEASFDPAGQGEMSAAELVAKFRSNAALAQPADRADLLERLVLAGDGGTPVRALADLLTA